MVVKQLCHNPARHFLLGNRQGSRAVGKDADIVILTPGRYAFAPSTSLSAVQCSSFEGRDFTVRVAATWCRGQQVYDGQRIVNQKGDGKFLHPRQT